LRDRNWIVSGWAALRDKTARLPVHLQEAAELDVDTGFGTARLGVDPIGLPQLLLPVAPGARLARSDEPPLLRALVNRLADRDGARPYLVVTCLDRNLDRGFADLVESVLGRIETGEGSLAAYASAVQDFRALFTHTPTEQVDERRIRGLVAELLYLERLVAIDTRAVALWFGPDKDRHDFRGGQSAVEVKSTPRLAGRVTVSGLEQLSAPSAGKLMLRRYVLESSPAGPESVGSIYRRLAAAGASRDDLLARLAAMECRDPVSAAWNHVTFNAEVSETYRVTDDFPRLTSVSFAAGVPAGVSEVTYRIDLAQAAHLTVGAAELDEFEQAMLKSLDA
jgi:hypothetical protein